MNQFGTRNFHEKSLLYFQTRSKENHCHFQTVDGIQENNQGPHPPGERIFQSRSQMNPGTGDGCQNTNQQNYQ